MDSELFAAAITGNNIVLKMRHSVTGVANQLTPTKNTVLHLAAAESGKAECVEQILKRYPGLLCKTNSKDETALHVAVRGGHLNVVRVLLDYAKKASSSERSENDVHLQLIRMLNEEKESALHEAVRHDYVHIVKFLVEKDPNDQHSPNKHHMTPLYLATFKGHVASVKVIIENCKQPTGIEPTDKGPDGRTILHAAVMSGSTECVRRILGTNSNLTNEKDNNGWTALHYAAYFNFSEIIKDITDQEKSIAYVTDKTAERTALHVAAQLGNLAAVKQLIKHCPYSCDMVDKKGRNILHLAVEYNHKTVIEYILQNCPMIQTILNQKDKLLKDDKYYSNNTPLHYAAIYGCFVPLLIKHKLVQRDALNKDSLTPLDLIRGHHSESGSEQEKVENLLVQIGAAQNLNLKSTLDLYKPLPHQNATDERLEITRKLSRTRMFIVAFIATITLAVAANLIKLPGGNMYQDS